jgi:3-hydroxyisobutyrate dehydrogenase-like beta-hydroxyacid dehydrogenase
MPTTGAPSDAAFGFVGIGVMRYGMAMSLRAKISKSSSLVVCEINEKRRDHFVEEASEHGTTLVASTPREVAEKSGIIITMLRRAPHVVEVFTNPRAGFLAIDRPEKPNFFIKCSSISTSNSTTLASQVRKSGFGYYIDPCLWRSSRV